MVGAGVGEAVVGLGLSVGSGDGARVVGTGKGAPVVGTGEGMSEGSAVGDNDELGWAVGKKLGDAVGQPWSGVMLCESESHEKRAR